MFERAGQEFKKEYKITSKLLERTIQVYNNLLYFDYKVDKYDLKFRIMPIMKKI